jgi:hypothetical protein
MATVVNNFSDLQKLLNMFVSANQLTPGLAPHGTFWTTLSYEEFVSPTQAVPGVPSITPILVKGDSKKSNIIMALSGTPGSPFDPNSGSIGQMPQPNPPYNANTPTQTDVINAIAAWIDNGCPN